jgi:fused signal recognition particle receptor
VESDIGVKTASSTVDRLREACRKKGLQREEDVKLELKSILRESVKALDLKFEKKDGELSFYLILGVNGVGKTTSIAKIAKLLTDKFGPDSTLLAAGDTFRAGAVEQLKIHARNLGVDCVSVENSSDPGAVMFEAVQEGLRRHKSFVLADTAGRLHNKANLVRELEKMNKIITAKLDGRPYTKLLVLDATTGQNGLQQAQIFNEAVKLDAIILTKYDSVARGGLLVSIASELGIPTAFVCTGESYADIEAFDPDKFLNEFVGL